MFVKDILGRVSQVVKVKLLVQVFYIWLWLQSKRREEGGIWFMPSYLIPSILNNRYKGLSQSQVTPIKLSSYLKYCQQKSDKWAAFSCSPQTFRSCRVTFCVRQYSCTAHPSKYSTFFATSRNTLHNWGQCVVSNVFVAPPAQMSVNECIEEYRTIPYSRSLH